MKAAFFRGRLGGVIFFAVLIFGTLSFTKVPAPMKVIPHRSFYRLPVSNGFVAAAFNLKKQAIDGFWPHIYKMIDQNRPVENLISNLTFTVSMNGSSLQLSKITFLNAGYISGTGIIRVKYGWQNWAIDLTLFAPMAGKRKALAVIFRVTPPAGNRSKRVDVQTLPKKIPGVGITEKSGWVKNRLFQKMFVFSVLDENQNSGTGLMNEAPGEFLLSEIKWWKNWQASSKIPVGLTLKQRKLFLQSLVILKMAQCREEGLSRGQILASLPPGMWNIAWVRDGAYSIAALTKSGHLEEARLGLAFMLRAKSGFYEHFMWHGKDYGVGVPYRISVCRYFGSGKEESDFNQNGPNIELDGFGLFLSALEDYVNESDNLPFLRKYWNRVAEQIADPLLKNIDSLHVIRAESGPWERHLPGAHFAYTTEAAIRGFQAAAHLANRLKDRTAAQKYERAASELREGFFKNFVDPRRRILKGKLEAAFPAYLDAAAIEGINWGIVDARSDLSQNTLRVYSQKLHLKNRDYGFRRLLSSDWYDSQEWVFVDFRMAKALRKAGEKEKADRIVHWIEEQAYRNFNLIAELFEENTADYKGAVPMAGYGAGAYVLNFDSDSAATPPK